MQPRKEEYVKDEHAGGHSGRSGYLRFLHQVIKTLPSFALVPDKRSVYFVSMQLCAFWNCGLTYAKSHDNKYIQLISFEGELIPLRACCGWQSCSRTTSNAPLVSGVPLSYTPVSCIMSSLRRLRGLVEDHEGEAEQELLPRQEDRQPAHPHPH